MDWKSIEYRLMGRAADDNRLPNVQRSREVLKHVRRHMKKLTKRRRALFRGPMPLSETDQYRLIRTALERGDKIVSFDAEWQYQWPNKITELGVAIYHNGTREVHNVRVRAGAGKPDKMTRFMTDDQAKRWLKGVFQGVGLLVGHAIKNDRDKMREWGWPLPYETSVPCLDTERWSRVLNPEAKQSQKLTTFCKNHGVEILKAHVAGNDALMTLEVALALAGMEENNVRTA
jgi:hypothetical protein